jgi:hypothetical protein
MRESNSISDMCYGIGRMIDIVADPLKAKAAGRANTIRRLLAENRALRAAIDAGFLSRGYCLECGADLVFPCNAFPVCYKCKTSEAAKRSQLYDHPRHYQGIEHEDAPGSEGFHGEHDEVHDGDR